MMPEHQRTDNKFENKGVKRKNIRRKRRRKKKQEKKQVTAIVILDGNTCLLLPLSIYYAVDLKTATDSNAIWTH